MEEVPAESTQPNINSLLEWVQPQCKSCIRPRVLGHAVLEAGGRRENVDWQKIHVSFVGYIALCPRNKAPDANDGDPCVNMIKDRRCQFVELAAMQPPEMAAKAEFIVTRAEL